MPSLIRILTANEITKVEIGRDLWSNPLLKIGHLELVPQDHAQVAYELLQRDRFHNIPGQPVPALSQ